MALSCSQTPVSLHRAGEARRFSPFKEFSKIARGHQSTVTCCIQATPLDVSHAAERMEVSAHHVPQIFPRTASSYVRDLLIADIDPATAKAAIGIMGPFLSAFGFLFILRIVMSWFPNLPVGKFPYVVAYAPTEPILRVTRKVIPPLGGVDVTPVVWFGLISFVNEILVGPQGLLVLLSQQIQTG